MKSYPILFIVFITLFSPEIKSQGLSNLWLFGYDSYTSSGFGGTDIDFFSGVANITSHQRPMNFTDANASITNFQGSLLFYTNGCFIANSLDSIMDNGDSLIYGPFSDDYCDYGSPFVQGALILPLPSTDSLFYLFYENISGWPFYGFPTELLASVIDMSQNNGFGKVIQKGNIIVNDTLLWGQLSAVKHANGRDWWILCHKENSEQFITILLTPQGIVSTNNQFIGNKISSSIAQICISPDGNKIARYSSVEDIDIFNFDRCTGLLSNFIHIPINDSGFVGGASFSSNSNFLYIFSTLYLYQFDVSSTNISSTQKTVAIYDGFTSPFPTQFYKGQLALDGKIYVCAPNGVNVLHVINYPDSLDTACNVVQHGISLPTYNGITMPTPPNYFLGPVTGSACDSLTSINDHLNEIKNFQIKPNPNNGKFGISYLLPQNKSGSFEVYDLIGKQVYRTALPPWSTLQNIQLPPLSNGVYNAVIKSGHDRVCKKIVVMKD